VRAAEYALKPIKAARNGAPQINAADSFAPKGKPLSFARRFPAAIVSRRSIPARRKTIATAAHDAAFLAAARALADAGRELAALGWTPATSSNFSARIDAQRLAITVSGRDKGRLTEADIMQVDLEGRALGTPQRPSAETLLHTQVYARFPATGAVLHTHSHNQTVASRLFARDGAIRIEGYELIKALRGHATHDTAIDLPVFPNTQDMQELVAHVDRWLAAGRALPGYLIDGHGLYAWGLDLPEARRHLDAIEFLLGCELDLRRLRS
jgi:methylthioribulose-1-phosphate dehydratase